MYEIYINENQLVIAEEAELASIDAANSWLVKYTSKKHLLAIVSMLEASLQDKGVVVLAPDKKAVFRIFKGLFQNIKAGGGVVLNDQGQFLAIYRRGHWDLPKGKREPEESYRQSALREVKEETGVKGLTLVDYLSKSYHVYRLKSGKRILKTTKWYLMSVPGLQKLKPQEEEGIEKVEWIEWAQLDWFCDQTYTSIAHFIHRHREEVQDFLYTFDRS